MKFFRHYKNKPYKYLGTAKHSETLEEMALYETRYENALGKLWVRPKEMFFEQIEIGGQRMARFQEIPLKIQTTTDVADKDIQIIAPIIEKAFGEWDPKWFYSTFRLHKNFHLIVGFIEGQAVGFKLGYETAQQEFYSWLGGVLPEYQGLGIASDLMLTQHQWLASQGYQRILTKTQNRFKHMLLLNIKNGFEIIGTHLSHEGGMKIMMEKKLPLL